MKTNENAAPKTSCCKRSIRANNCWNNTAAHIFQLKLIHFFHKKLLT